MEYFRMLDRTIDAAGERAAKGDPDLLAALITRQARFDLAIRKAVEGQRSAGVQWQSIADALGVTKSAVIQRFGSASRPGTFEVKAPSTRPEPGRQAGR